MITREYSARWVTLPHVHVHVHVHAQRVHVLACRIFTCAAHGHSTHSRCACTVHTRKAHMQRADHRRCIAYPYLGQHLGACPPLQSNAQLRRAGVAPSGLGFTTTTITNENLTCPVRHLAHESRAPRAPPCPPPLLLLHYSTVSSLEASYLILSRMHGILSQRRDGRPRPCPPIPPRRGWPVMGLL